MISTRTGPKENSAAIHVLDQPIEPSEELEKQNQMEKQNQQLEQPATDRTDQSSACHVG
jgi:hypothetical protein